MGFRPFGIDNADEKGQAALLNSTSVSELAGPCTYRFILLFFQNSAYESSRHCDGLGVGLVGGVNEIVDTLGVNEGLEGEG